MHVSVAYQHGVHQLTISVSPQAAKLLAGLVGGAPMLLVSAKRDVLLDVVAGKLEATRAVITGRVQVSDLGKLLVFKSAFRLKRAVFDAYKASLQLTQNGRAAPEHLDPLTKLQRSPPSAELLAELGMLQPAPTVGGASAYVSSEGGAVELSEALLFAVYAFTATDWTGDVLFNLSSELNPSSGVATAATAATAATSTTTSTLSSSTPPRVSKSASDGAAVAVLFRLSPSGVRLIVAPVRLASAPACSVACERRVLLAVLTGDFELTAALMSGQMHTDNFVSMMKFKRAFQLDRGAWREFQAWRRAHATPPAPAVEMLIDLSSPIKLAAPLPAPPATPPPPATATISPPPAAADIGLERLADDAELHMAASYLPVAFEASSMDIGVLCQLSREDGAAPRTLGIWVSPEGVRVYADEEAPLMPAVTCNISCEREVLMQIIRGEMEATNAIMSGLVMVDDLGQLMAFKMAFKLERAAFEEYLAKSKHGA